MIRALLARWLNPSNRVDAVVDTPLDRLAAHVAFRRAVNADWAEHRRSQLSPERRARIQTIIETGVRP